jgi:DNA repair photolyase
MLLRWSASFASRRLRSVRSMTYTTPFSITSQFSFCGLPLRLDTYRGCGFQCSYCFARHRGGGSRTEVIAPASPEHIARVVERALTEDGHGTVSEFLQRRVPIHFGGMSDPLQPAELRFGVTAAVLKILGRHKYPTVLSTRSTLASAPQYIDLLKKIGAAVVQFSFSSSRDDIASRVEPHASKPSELLRTMERLSSEGLHVTCRWQPYIPNVSEPPSEFMPRVARTGCKHVALEHLKIPVERAKPLWSSFIDGIEHDIFEKYSGEGAVRDGREWVLPSHRKIDVVRAVREEAHVNSMTFGAADNEFQHFSDTSCCCSGVDQFEGFENWFRYQIGYAIRESRGRSIDLQVIQNEWAPSGSIDRFLNSRSRLSAQTGQQGTVRDHIFARWNRPNSPGSPSTFFGITAKEGGSPNNPKVTYEWNNAILEQMWR